MPTRYRSTTLAIALVLATSFAAAAQAQELPQRRPTILDASGSMKAALPDGKTRMEAAKVAVAEFATGLASIRALHWAYGHQSPTSKKDCSTSLLRRSTYRPAKAGHHFRLVRSSRRDIPPITYSLMLASSRA